MGWLVGLGSFDLLSFDWPRRAYMSFVTTHYAVIDFFCLWIAEFVCHIITQSCHDIYTKTLMFTFSLPEKNSNQWSEHQDLQYILHNVTNIWEILSGPVNILLVQVLFFFFSGRLCLEQDCYSFKWIKLPVLTGIYIFVFWQITVVFSYSRNVCFIQNPFSKIAVLKNNVYVNYNCLTSNCAADRAGCVNIWLVIFSQTVLPVDV